MDLVFNLSGSLIGQISIGLKLCLYELNIIDPTRVEPLALQLAMLIKSEVSLLALNALLWDLAECFSSLLLI